MPVTMLVPIIQNTPMSVQYFATSLIEAHLKCYGNKYKLLILQLLLKHF
jgi:hypothetical protein